MNERTVIGAFDCDSGWLLVCDSPPEPAMVEVPSAQALHLEVLPGRYEVTYVAGNDGPDSIPARVLVARAGLTAIRLVQIGTLAVEGGRIAVLEREMARAPAICDDFLYEAADAIQHGAGFVISTWGDGGYDVLTDNPGGPATTVCIVLDDDPDGEVE